MKTRRFACNQCGQEFETSAAWALYCPDCREKIHREQRRARQEGKALPRAEVKRVSGLPPKKPVDVPARQTLPKRACHDCGRPTTDYRCAACWEKLRRKLGLNLSGQELEDY